MHYAGTVRKDRDINMRMNVKSYFCPDFCTIPWTVRSRMWTFKEKMLALFKKAKARKTFSHSKATPFLILREMSIC